MLFPKPVETRSIKMPMVAQSMSQPVQDKYETLRLVEARIANFRSLPANTGEKATMRNGLLACLDALVAYMLLCL